MMRREYDRKQIIAMITALLSVFSLMGSEVFGGEAWQSYHPFTDPNYGAQASVDLARVEQLAAEFQAEAPWTKRGTEYGAIGGAAMPIPATYQQPPRVGELSAEAATAALFNPFITWDVSPLGYRWFGYGRQGFSLYSSRYPHPFYHDRARWGWPDRHFMTRHGRW